MSKWSLTERLQPSLLDRLTDERPDKKKESAGDSELSQHELKNAVIRDLGSLLNSVNLSVVEDSNGELRVTALNGGGYSCGDCITVTNQAEGGSSTVVKVIDLGRKSRAQDIQSGCVKQERNRSKTAVLVLIT